MSRRDDNPWRRSAPLAVAHRGQRATFPEQTLEAYMEAIRLGADGIETDVQRTRDGRLAMIHDLTLDRTTNGHGPIAGLDWADVRALDAGSWLGERFAGPDPVARGDDRARRRRRASCCASRSRARPRRLPGRPSRSPGCIRDRGLLDQVFISSFDHAALAAARDEVGSPLLAPERLPEGGPSDPDSRSHRRPRSTPPSSSTAGRT